MRPEHWIYTIPLRLRSLFRRAQGDEELDDELRDHLERRIEEYVAQGMTQEEAHRRARVDLGGIEQTKAKCRDARRVNWIQNLLQDWHFGLRQLRRNPGFTSIAVLTLALGIGASSAIFSIVNGTLLRPLPFKDASRLVVIQDSKPSAGVDWVFVPPVRYEEWVRRNSAFEEIAAAENCYFKLQQKDSAVLLQGGCVSANFFPMLGVQPVLGRWFTATEDQPGGSPVALLSYGCWKEHFGADPRAIGKTVRRTANDVPFTIIGVLPPSFRFATDDFALWAPLRSDPNYSVRDERNLLAFGHLKANVSLAQAQADMDRVSRQLAPEFPKTSAGWEVTVRPLQDFYSDVRNIRQTLWILLAAVGFLLLIACANIAHLLLARTTSRSREIVVRRALGATRLRILRQLLTESVLLAGLGGVAGFLLARSAFRSLLSFAPYIPSFRPDALRMDNSVFAFAMVVSILAGVLFGLAPALQSAHRDVNTSLYDGLRDARSSRRRRVASNLLVASEVAIALVLLTGSGLLIRSFRNLRADRLGFNTSHMLVSLVATLDESHYHTPQETAAFYRQLFARLRTVPGVSSVSGASDLPLRRFYGPGVPLEVMGLAPPKPGGEPTADFLYVDPQFFETMQIPLLRGRLFSEHDDEQGAPVAIVNQSFAQRVWHGEDSIGRELRPITGDNTTHWYRVVGVVADTKERGVGTDPQPTVYRSYYQNVARYTFLLIRTRPDPQSLMGAVKSAIISANHGLPLNAVATLDQSLAESVSAQRFSMLLITLFAGLALALAAVGIYGVIAYSVTQRTHEFGIRLALGSSPKDIMAMMLREGIGLVTVGLVVGGLAALELTRFVRALLYGVGPADPVSLGGAVGVLILTALLAHVIPARHAAEVDPMVALRHE